MASTQLLVSTPKVQLEDPLSYLPRSAVTEYGKGETIYGESAAIPYLFLVVDGRGMVSRFKSRDSYFIIDIYQRDEFFGESVFLRSLGCREQARALEYSRVMSWTREDVEQIIPRQPLLALPFVQLAVQRAATFIQRIESLCTENV